MTDLNRYSPLCRKLLAEARGQQIGLELLFSASENLSVRVFNAQLDKFTRSGNLCLGIRALLDGSEGIAYTERLDEQAALETLREAVENARICHPPHPVRLPRPPPLKTSGDFFYNPDLEKLSADDLTAFALEMEATARNADKRIINVPYAFCGVGSSASRLVTSEGVDLCERENGVQAYIGVLACEGDERRSGGEAFWSRNWHDFSAGKIAMTAVNEALSLLGGIPLPESGSFPVVLRPDAFADLLEAFIGQFSAKQIQDGRSLFKDKIGKKIAAPGFSIIDDPKRPDGSSSRLFDAEGFPCEPLTVIGKGILENVLHNTQTADADQTRTNARAARSPKGSLNVSPTNWIVSVDERVSQECLISGKQVVEVALFQGIHAGVNSTSGDFSLMAEGFLYEDGVLKGSLKPFTVSGGFMEMLEKIVCASDTFKMTLSGIGTPSIRIENLAVSGS